MSTVTTAGGPPAAGTGPVTGSVGLGDVVRAEYLKLRTTRLWWGMLLTGVLLVLAFSALAAAVSGLGSGPEAGGGPTVDPTSPASLRSIYGTGFTGGYFVPLVLGIIAMTGEYRHLTITTTLLAVPRRARVVLGKIVTYFLAGLAYGVALTVAALVGGAVVLAIRGYGPDLGAEGVPRTLLLGVLGCGVWAVFGLGLGTLIRNQVVAVVVVLVVVFIVEPIVTVLLNIASWGGAIARFLPGSASSAIVAGPGGDDGGGLALLPWWGGLLVLAAYGVVLGGLGVLLTTRRDVT